MTTLRYRPRRTSHRLSADQWGYLRAGLYPVYPPRDPFADVGEAADAYDDVRDQLLTEHPVDVRGPWAFWAFEPRIPAELRELPREHEDREPVLAARRTWLDGGVAA